MKEFRTLVPFLKEHKWRYVLGILALFFVDVASLLTPQVTKRFSDAIQTGELTYELAAWCAIAIVVLGLCVAVGRYGWRINIFGTARTLDYWLRDKLFQKYLHLDDQFFNQRRTGDLMAHLTNDVMMVRNSMGGGVLMIVDALFMSVFTVGMMIYTVGIKSALMALIALPFLTLVVLFISKPLQQRSRDVQDTFSELTTEVQENISGIQNIKAFGIEGNRGQSFAKMNDKYEEKNLALVRISAIFEPIIGLIAGVALVIFIYYSMNEMLHGRMSFGEFTSAIQYLMMMIWPLIAIGMVVGSFQRGVASMTRINEIFHSHPKVQETEHPEALPEGPCTIEFKDVHFRYGEDLPWVLEGVSFTLNERQSLAILGRTGSGKSTILKLLLRRFDVQKGQILVNGKDVRDLKFEDLYKKIAFVEQENYLFSRTIGGNVAFTADDEYDKVKVREATDFSQITSDIEEMPEAFDTWVGERGITLSGGQKQRVSIARAYYAQAEVLVMDDSLSAVDTNTEKRILDQLEEFGQSLILVSQRVSTVQRADRILVIENGKITQEGTHDSLMSEVGGFYQELYERQLLEMKLEDSPTEEQVDGTENIL